MSRAVGYVRVSTVDQAESGLGLEAQRTAIEACASRLGLELVTIHEDAGLSGSLAISDRPGLLAAIDQLERGDVLLVGKRDRLARDLLHACVIERLVVRRGARIVSAAGEGTDDDGPNAVLLRRLLDCLAEYERLVIGARTSAALRAKRARGERAGAIPFGWRAEGGRLEPEPSEQRALELMLELDAKGESYGAIARALTAAGHKPRGKRWYAQSAKTILGTAARTKLGNSPKGT